MAIEVSYHRRGEGEPLVLLHGIGHRWQAWEPVLDRLAGHHDVIAVDLPGFGASPMLPADRVYDVPGSVAVLGEVFADLGLDRPHVAGNSLGAMLSLELASKGMARSATAFAPAGFWTPRDRAWALAVLTNLRRSARLSPALQRNLFSRDRFRAVGAGILFGKPGRVTAEVMLADLAALAASPAFDAVASSGRGYVFRSPAPEVPVTVAWGSKDRILFPRQAKRAQELLPRARHVPLPGCGHVPMGDDPDRVAQLIIDTCREAATDRAA